MLVLIQCAGDQTRWREAGGQGLKQLVEVDGESLIARTYRLAAGHPATVTRTVVKNPGDPVWIDFRPALACPETWMGEMAKLLQHRHLWPASGPVCVLFGDTYYTDEVMDLILAGDVRQPTVYGRANTPNRRLEAFAFRFDVTDGPLIERVARECAEHGMNLKGGLWRWFHRLHHPHENAYKSARVKETATPDNGWVEIPADATDDFDRPSDLRAWRRQRRIAAQPRT